jgi:putative membrane protein
MVRVRLIRAAACASLVFALAPPLVAQAPPKAGDVGTADTSGPSADPARTPDATFLAKAAEGNALDVELARLGVARAVHADVKAFAASMLDAAGAIDAGLAGLAKAKSLALASPPAPPRTPAADVAAHRDADFDVAFVAVAIARHDAAIALFEAESRDGRDEEVKDWAARQLPALRAHHGTAKGLRPRSGS